MNETFTLAYGETACAIGCTRGPDLYSLDPDTTADAECRISAARFAERIEAFWSKGTLDLKNPAVVVADKTRLCGYRRYLPVLLETLCRHGAPRERLTVWIAYGTHGRQTDTESRAAYGPAFDAYRWIHHQCEGDHFVQLGVTSRGTPIRLPRDLAAASCIITFGAISHHYFAGFGGGRKLLFPGLGETSAIYANHGLFLDHRHRRLAERCRPGILNGNPLAEDLAEIEARRPADMAIHGILDSSGQVLDLMVGQGADHFRAACAKHASQSEVVCRRSYDLVVAGAGGHPKDINFIQSHKAIHHAADFVADGGRLVVLAQCRDGIGSDTFLPWFGPGGWDGAFDRLSEAYAGNGGTALAMMDKCRRFHIGLVTELDPQSVALMGAEHWTLEMAQQRIDQHDGPWALIPNANMLVARQAI